MPISGALSNLVGSAISAASQPSAGEKERDRIGAENRAAMRKLLEGAAAANNPQEVEALAQQARSLGVDPSGYMALAGIMTPEEKTKRRIDDALSQVFMGLMGMGGGGVSTPASTSTPTPAPTQTQSTSVAPITPTETTPEEGFATLDEQPGLMRDMLYRAAAKKFMGFDVGAHYFEAPQWFAEHAQLMQAGQDSEAAMLQLAHKYGFIPDGASNLKLSESTKNALFEREFAKNLADPTMNEILLRMKPEGRDFQRWKTGKVLEAIAATNGYIPEHYLPLLNRARNLMPDVDYVEDELRTWVLQMTGLPLEDHPEPDLILAQARELRDKRELFNAVRQTTETERAKTKVEYELEHYKPVSAEDAAKQGIDLSKYPTYESITAAGKRFPSEKELNTYNTIRQGLIEITNLKDLLFGPDGVFYGVGGAWHERKWQQKDMWWNVYNESERGLRIKEYEAVRDALVAKIARMKGEVGVLTDRDITRQVRAFPDTGGLVGAPDSEELARRKFNRYIEISEETLNNLLETTTIPGKVESQVVPPPDAAQTQAPDKSGYTVGEFYPSADGKTEAQYQGMDENGELKWGQIRPRQQQ